MSVRPILLIVVKEHENNLTVVGESAFTFESIMSIASKLAVTGSTILLSISTCLSSSKHYKQKSFKHKQY